MTETGLILAEVAFLILLYAFVWAVVRSSSRQVGAAGPPPAPPPHEEAPHAPGPAAAAPPAPRPAPPPPPPPPPPPAPEPEPEPESPQPTAEPIGEPTPAGTDGRPPAEEEGPAGEEPPTETAGSRRDSQQFDFAAANLTPRLVVESSPALEEGREIDLTGGLTIGRSGGAGLSIGDQFVSHMHARVLRRGRYYHVEDLGSTNGTFLNERRIERDARLKVRDNLRIGQTTLRYEE